MNVENLLNLPDGPLADEQFENLLRGGSFRLQRIVSTGHTTPPGEWYDQDDDEWVLLLTGAARLRMQDEADPIEMRPGDWINIPAGKRHRVDWTDPDQATIWLALRHRPSPEQEQPQTAKRR